MKFFRLVYWKLIDAKRKIKTKKEDRKIHLYGITGFFGLPGKGKTMALVWQLEEYRKKYGDKIYIMTNFNYKNQDLVFTSWKDLLKTYDKPLVCAWDEVQNEFNSRDFKTFPVPLLTLLTQNRKGNGVQILYTAQRFNRVDKIFRELSHWAVECSTFAGRLTSLKYYHWMDYEQLNQAVGVDLKMSIKPTKRTSFIQTDELRNCYDSYAMLETAKSKEYREFNPAYE